MEAPVDDDRLREIRERLALATVASCNCGVKTFQAEYHESACRYRALTEADDLIASLQARVVEMDEEASGHCMRSIQALGMAAKAEARAKAAEAELDRERKIVAAVQAYNDHLRNGYRVFLDGNAWCAVGPGFIDLQESTAAFGETPYQALGSLLEIEGRAALKDTTHD